MSARLVSGLCLLLCACGGGGGGGGGFTGSESESASTQTSPSQPSEPESLTEQGDFTPAGQTWADAVPFIKVRGRAIQANVPTVSPGRAEVYRFSAPSSATLAVETDTDGNLTAAELRHQGREARFGPDETGVQTEPGRTDRKLAVNFTDPSNSPLEYSSFGTWVDATTDEFLPKGRVSAGAFGTPTPASDRPSGDATYFGASEGFTEMGGNVAVTASNVAVQVTDGFSRVQVDSFGTLAANLDGASNIRPLPGHDFSANGRVTNDGYEASGDGMTVNGDFYGPNAEETAGVFRGRRDGENYGGAFGAIR